MNTRTLTSRLTLTLLTFFVLTACAAQPTPAPEVIDPAGFATYTHPSGTFSLSLPPDWVVSDTSDSYALNVGFSPPGSPEPMIRVTVVEVNALLGGQASAGSTVDMNVLIDRYQSAFYRTGEATYEEVSREPQPDGSTRVQYVLKSPNGTTQNNDFMQVSGPYFAVMRVTLPGDDALLATLNRVSNTLEVNAGAGWSGLAGGENASTSAVGFTSLNHWVDGNGGFVLVGQVRNNASQPLEFVRINAQLYDAEGELLLEQDDFVSSDRIAPGEYAPFSITFADGLPDGTVRYDIAAAARYASATSQTFYGEDNFALTSAAEFDDNGVMVVSGQVRNEGTETVRLVKVIVAVFDASHRIVGTDTTLVDVQELAPGESSAYNVRFFELGGTPETFRVTVQGTSE